MLIEKVEKIIKEEKLIESGDRIVVGVSGGPDSICLLHVLQQIQKRGLNFEINVAHINHMIRANAILDEEYVENYCKKQSIPVFIKRISVLEIAEKEKIGTEEAGRNVRYHFFEEVKEKTNSNKIATAHNSNDNAETVIMNLIRGCGIDGLKGIERKTGNLIRPLIDISREEIEDYCKQNNLNPRIDESNEQLIYQRNKVRNVMIPYIQKEFNANFVGTLNRLSQIAKEEADFIEQITKKQYEKIVKKEDKGLIELDLKQFNLLETVIKKRVLRYTIYRVLGNVRGIATIHMEDIVTMCEKEIGNKYLTPNKNIKITIKNKKIIFEAI